MPEVKIKGKLSNSIYLSHVDIILDLKDLASQLTLTDIMALNIMECKDAKPIVQKPICGKEKEIELLIHETRWDMDKLVVSKINELISAHNERVKGVER